MRKVKIFKWVWDEKTDKCDEVADGVGLFIQYGVNFVELDEGIGNYTSVIVEKSDGTILNLPTELVVFND